MSDAMTDYQWGYAEILEVAGTELDVYDRVRIGRQHDPVDRTTRTVARNKGVNRNVPGLYTMRIEFQVMKPAYGESNVPLSSLITARTNRTSVTVTLKEDSEDSGEELSARVFDLSEEQDNKGNVLYSIVLEAEPTDGS